MSRALSQLPWVPACGLRKRDEAPAPWALASHPLLLKETKQTTAVLARVDSSHGRGSCILWMLPGGCCGGWGMYCCQSPVGTMAGRGISRAFGIGTGKKSQAGGGSRRSGRGTRQGRLSFLEQKGLDRPIPPSVGEGGWASRVCLWGEEGPQLCQTLREVHISSQCGLWCQRCLGSSPDSSL